MDSNKRTVNRHFPRVPTEDKCAPDDVVGRVEARQQEVRESFIALEELKLIRDKLKACYEREGVDHLTKCKGLSDAYLARLSFKDYVPPPGKEGLGL